MLCFKVLKSSFMFFAPGNENVPIQLMITIICKIALGRCLVWVTQKCAWLQDQELVTIQKRSNSCVFLIYRKKVQNLIQDRLLNTEKSPAWKAGGTKSCLNTVCLFIRVLKMNEFGSLKQCYINLLGASKKARWPWGKRKIVRYGSNQNKMVGEKYFWWYCWTLNLFYPVKSFWKPFFC